MPPRLQRSSMRWRYLLEVDLVDLILYWPQSLAHLDLQFNEIEVPPAPLPPNLRTLILRGNSPDGDRANEWIPELPPTFRLLSMEDAGSAIFDLAPFSEVVYSNSIWT
ncbi:hypothetical protein AMAG_07242 [Allomyces macrogynus ATCC 38327]|uniref:Uncharacterized protein n=1 Tax=Allomyces macrogynus (strain ATCC 38327) TaxID=578462 RepID=A0A0L0SHR5_ALLM3|nr:hypothetical protein AMAG_07242 [Allomyces macrogynus ATCC 38327]|eukprot:KNE61979.1 hypothetical protein AMAG_07242 [Allomyces macrogynus ATCC 38327]